MTAPQQRVPELIPGVDVRSLPLTALDGFVLSRIDGRSTTMEIVSLTGLGYEQVEAILERLRGLGAVRFKDQGSSASQSRSEPAPAYSERPTGTRSLPPPGAPKRRIHSMPPQRRMLAESSVSQAPPDIRSSQRPRTATSSSMPPTGRHPILTPPSQRPVQSGTPAKPGPRVPADRGVPNAAGTVERLGPASAQDKAAGRGPTRSEVTAEQRPQEQPNASARASALGSASERASVPPVQQAPSVPASPSVISQPPVAISLAPGALYDPRELEEEVDLPLERRKQLLDIFYRLKELDYYEALGVPYDADKKQVRAAYFALSKVFHPDSMFRKNLGSFKAKMEAVFNYLTEGYETLGKKKNRDEYDAYLRSTKATQMAERALAMRKQAAQAERDEAVVVNVPPPPLVPVISEPPPSDSRAPSAPAPPREASAEARRLAQEVIARRLRGFTNAQRPAAPRPEPVATPSPPPSPSQLPPRTDPQELLRRLTRTLKDVGQLTGTNDKVTRAVKASQAAFARGDIHEAAQQMSKAVSLAPERDDLRVEFDRLTKMLSEKLANDYIEQAKFEMKNNKWASAAITWAKVCDGRPDDAVAHRSAAFALYKAGGDLRGAQKYAQQASFLAPDDIEARLLLAQIYLTVGLKLNARRELDAAAKLDPENEMVKNLLADLKG